MEKISLIIAAAGKGERSGLSENKLLFKDASGKTVLERTLFAFVRSGIIDEYVVAVSPADKAVMEKLLPKEVKLVVGGKTRSESVKNALEAVTGEIVLIHDGARPFVSKEIISACAESAKKFGSGIAAAASRDTICKADSFAGSESFSQNGCSAKNRGGAAGGSPCTGAAGGCFDGGAAGGSPCNGSADGCIDGGAAGGAASEFGDSEATKITEYIGKSGLYSVQTPQGFRTELIKKAYALAGERTFNDDGEVYATYIGAPVLTAGNSKNVKLTFKEDFEPTSEDCFCGEFGKDGLKKLSGAGEYRFGTGFDCHKFAENRKLILGGVEIAHDKGLLGHSDADVLSHAITDAILSAAAMRDIGYHFPDTDPAYEGADSIKLLKTALELVGEKGFAVTSVSATIMAEKPKLLKRIPEITANLAAALGIKEDKVGIAATTLEGLGFVGREEGICVQATATLFKKRRII